MSFSVLLKTAKELSVSRDAQVFCDVLGLSDYEARAHISRNPQGIIATGIDEAAAHSLKASLDERAYTSLVVPDTMINTLDLKMVKIASITETVYLEDFYGNGVHLPFEDISAVAVCMNRETEKNTALEREFFLDVVFSDGTVLRFNSKKFNYGYLEDRKSHSVIQNFISLLNDLEERIPENIIKDLGYSQALAQQFDQIKAPENSRLWNQYLLWLSHNNIIKLDQSEIVSYEKAQPVQDVIVTDIEEDLPEEQEDQEDLPEEPEDQEEEEQISPGLPPESKPPLQEVTSKTLNKQIRAVCKALESGRGPEDIAAKMIDKGVPPEDAQALTQVLNSFNIIGEDEDKKVWILEQNKIPEKFHSNFLNIIEKVGNQELLEKVRNKQGISKEARRKGAIKTGRIAMLVISFIFLISAFVHWKGSNNTVEKFSQELNYRYGSYASERMKALPEFEDMQFKLKMMTIASASFGGIFLLLALYAGINPYQSCRLGFLFFICLIGYEVYLYQAAIMFNFAGHLVKVFGITSLFYAYIAAKKQRIDEQQSAALATSN